MTIASILLLMSMFVIAVMRIYLPIGVQTSGKPLATISLALSERFQFHRLNLYLIGGVLLIGTLGEFVTGALLFVSILGCFALLTAPVRYAFTEAGIAVNNVVFREWSDFTGVRELRAHVVLVGVEGQRDLRLHVAGNNRRHAIQIINRCIGARGTTHRDVRRAKGAGSGTRAKATLGS